MKRVRIRSTTVLAVRRGGHVVIGGDGQVTMGNTVVKASARKIRRLADGKIVAGFAGSAADGITLFEKFEARLKEFNGNLARAAVGLYDVARAGEEQDLLAIGHQQQRLEPAQHAIGAPVLGQLDRGAAQAAVELLQLGFELVEQGQGVGRGAGESRQHAIII